MILLNHENHFNHIQITVQTNEQGDRKVSTDAPLHGLLYGRYHNTPPTPSQEGRAEQRSAVCGNTGSHFIILNSSFLTLNSKEGRAERRGAVCGNTGRHLITNKGACPLAGIKRLPGFSPSRPNLDLPDEWIRRIIPPFGESCNPVNHGSDKKNRIKLRTIYIMYSKTVLV
jgi:hypothetical protein